MHWIDLWRCSVDVCWMNKKEWIALLPCHIHCIFILQQLCSVVTIITSVLLMSKPRPVMVVWFSQDSTVMSGSAQKWSQISARLKSSVMTPLEISESCAHTKLTGKIGHNYLWILFTKRWLFITEARLMNETLEDCCKCLWPEQWRSPNYRDKGRRRNPWEQQRKSEENQQIKNNGSVEKVICCKYRVRNVKNCRISSEGNDEAVWFEWKGDTWTTSDHMGEKPAIASFSASCLNCMKSVAYQMAIIHGIKDLIPGLASWNR